jgi:hypothetical protein
MLATAEQIRDEIVRLCGLSSLLGPGILRRALKDAGVDATRATLGDYRRALPRLELRLVTYLDPRRAQEAVVRIREFLDATEAGSAAGGEK